MKTSAQTVKEQQQTANEFYKMAREAVGRQRYDEAISLFNSSLKELETAAAYHDLGVTYYLQGDHQKALEFFMTAVKADPQYHEAYANMAELHRERGNILQAIEGFAGAIKACPGQLSYKEKFLDMAQHTQVSRPNPGLKNILLDCLRADIDFSGMGATWHSVLIQEPDFKKIYKLALKGKFTSFEKALGKISQEPLFDPYFLLGLQKTVVYSIDFETFLTALRRYLLRNRDRRNENLLAALASYCFATGYIFSVTEEEESAVAGLQKPLKAGDPGEVALFACYRPLNELKDAEKIATHHDAFKRQLDSYARLQKTRQEIVPLTSIDNKISRAVREQYEEFPYPRWSRLSKNLAVPSGEEPIKERKADILVAGCGTGQEALELAAIFPAAQILAVDLSTSSLAYGMQKAREHGLKNVTFRHADILNLGELEQRFDLIASSGVLHHMEDPVAGWRVLAGLLKPGGIMRLGLYSRVSRRSLAAARKAIEKGNYPSDAAGIRRFRADSRRLLKKADFRDITSSRDFYYMPECRDMLFHVQEHEFDPAQIGQILGQLGLEFLQFWVNPDIQRAYLRANPSDPQARDLKAWAAFEEKNPEIFKGLCRFWCGKPPIRR